MNGKFYILKLGEVIVLEGIFYLYEEKYSVNSYVRIVLEVENLIEKYKELI